MVKTILWTKNKKMQTLFDREREKIAQSEHPMAINYTTWFDPTEIVAYTITYEKNNVYLCSTIGRKSYWPKGVYRVLNRLFKGEPVDIVTKHISHFWMDHVEEQIKFLNSIQDFRTAIISRKQGYRRVLTKFKSELADRNLEFTLSQDPVWVCNDCHNPECLQDVLYYGTDCLDKFNGE